MVAYGIRSMTERLYVLSGDDVRDFCNGFKICTKLWSAHPASSEAEAPANTVRRERNGPRGIRSPWVWGGKVWRASALVLSTTIVACWATAAPAQQSGSLADLLKGQAGLSGAARVDAGIDQDSQQQVQMRQPQPVTDQPLSSIERDFLSRLRSAMPQAGVGRAADQAPGLDGGQDEPGADYGDGSGGRGQYGATLPQGQGAGMQSLPYPQSPPRSRSSTVALRQFGYDSLGTREITGSRVAGAIADDYVLGVGDEVVVTLRGQRNETIRARVDRDGRLVLPDISPIPVAGDSLGTVRQRIEAQASQVYLKAEVFVSVGAVRSIGVYVLGEVPQPGLQRLSGLSTLLEAVAAAGGVNRTGTLRAVTLTRNGQTKTFDLYELLTHGQLSFAGALADGDRVVVKSIGATLAVAGEVRRPGIFELRPGNSAMSVADALGLAGGLLRPEGYRFLKIGADRSGRDHAVEISANDKASLKSGDILLVMKARGSEIGGISVDGHVSVPGIRSLEADPTVRSLVSDSGLFKDNPYLLMGVLQTTDLSTRSRFFVPIDLARVLEGNGDLSFRQDDRLIVLGMDDIRYLGSADVQAVLRGETPPSVLRQMQARAYSGRAQDGEGLDLAGSDAPDTASPAFTPAQQTGQRRNQAGRAANNDDEPVCRSLKNLAAIARVSRQERFANAVQAIEPRKDSVVLNVQDCPPVFERYPELLPFLLDHVVTVQGEVRQPGGYPVAPGTPLSSLVSVAGGMSRDADLGQIELTRFDDVRNVDKDGVGRLAIDGRRQQLQLVALNPGDIVRINPAFSSRDVGPVTLRGEVKRPGLYNIYRGEHLSSLIARAGGLTDEAYPLGAVFGRVSVRKAEEQSNQMAARQFETALGQTMLAAARTSQGSSVGSMAALQSMIASVRNAPASGRMVVEADPSVLMVRPELDTVMEPGDVLNIPKRPNHVTITGEVLNPGTQQFDSTFDAERYLDLTGGLTRWADEDRIFVVLPNGQARPVSRSSWNYTPLHIPPGSTIVVPKDPLPYTTYGFAKELIDLFSKVALSGASLAVISR